MALRPRAQQPTTHPVEHVFPTFGVDVFESHHASGWQMPEVAHDFLKIVLVHDGRGQLETHDGAVPAARGDVLVVHPEVRHRIVDEDLGPDAHDVERQRLRVVV
ncbi:MAG: AraC family ligand binding domain-containing protein, partial [Planctomycetota bacterium]